MISGLLRGETNLHFVFLNKVLLDKMASFCLCSLVSHLHGVDAALSDGSSQRACHQSLCDAQRLLVASN